MVAESYAGDEPQACTERAETLGGYRGVVLDCDPVAGKSLCAPARDAKRGKGRAKRPAK
jgi:hypothetical protein